MRDITPNSSLTPPPHRSPSTQPWGVMLPCSHNRLLMQRDVECAFPSQAGISSGKRTLDKRPTPDTPLEEEPRSAEGSSGQEIPLGSAGPQLSASAKLREQGNLSFKWVVEEGGRLQPQQAIAGLETAISTYGKVRHPAGGRATHEHVHGSRLVH